MPRRRQSAGAIRLPSEERVEDTQQMPKLVYVVMPTAIL